MLKRLLIPLLTATLLAGCAAQKIDPRTFTTLPVEGAVYTEGMQALQAGMELRLQVRRFTDQQSQVVVDQPLAVTRNTQWLEFEFLLPAPSNPATLDLLQVVAVQGNRPQLASDPVPLLPVYLPVEAGELRLSSADQIAFGRRYQCGRQELDFGHLGGFPRMATAGHIYELAEGASVPGNQRYWSVEQRTTQLVDQGRRLLVVINGKRLPDCLPIPAPELPLEARGYQPDWYLHLSPQLVQFEELAGDQAQRLANVGRTDQGAAQQLLGADQFTPLVASLTPTLCRDAKSGAPHPFRVSIDTPEERFEGCGGDIRDLLVSHEWKINRLAGNPPRSRAPLAFTLRPDGSLSGYGACNRFSASWELVDTRIKISNLHATPMNCRPSLEQQEELLFRLLAYAQELDFEASGALLLRGSSGVLRAVSSPLQL